MDEPIETIVENGEIGIFSLNGEAYIKKLQDDQNGGYFPKREIPSIPVRELHKNISAE